jgi:anti-sigma-K factor RskA
MNAPQYRFIKDISTRKNTQPIKAKQRKTQNEKSFKFWRSLLRAAIASYQLEPE